MLILCCFFIKHKTAYDMRISDWSSDVCSSDLQLKKQSGRLTGWLSYTLSKTERLIEGINNNNWYNARQDRTHDIAIVAMYQLSPRWNFSANWVFYRSEERRVGKECVSTGRYRW